MSKYDPNEQDLDELLRQVDSLLEGEPDEDDWFDRDRDDINIDEYTPDDLRDDSDQLFYQNYSNDYGRQVRNYQNSYGGTRQVPQSTPAEPSVIAYNADFRTPKREREEPRPKREVPRKTEYTDEYRDYGEADPPAKQPRRQKAAPQPGPAASGRPKGCCGCGCGTVLIALALMIAAVFFVLQWAFEPPRSDDSLGQRKKDTATVLICGTDADGTRTDTMMLMYLSGSEKQVGLLSLPRDTYTVATAGYAAKLNSAYGRNNCGAEGMEALLDYVQDIIGYRPDGYILVDMTLVPQLVDLMGGVEADVPVAITDAGLDLQPGLQYLDGQEVLALLRHRSSYAMADLTRVEVQRSVIKACLDQWVSLDHLSEVKEALTLVENNSLSSLSTRNYLWMAKTVLTSLSKGFVTETLPGRADYIGGSSFYLLDRQAVADMINESFNPYRVTIDPEELNIAG